MISGFPRLSALFANLLKRMRHASWRRIPSLPVNLAQLKSMRRIREFDDRSPRYHGFADAIDHYRQCSAMPLLNQIAKPTYDYSR